MTRHCLICKYAQHQGARYSDFYCSWGYENKEDDVKYLLCHSPALSKRRLAEEGCATSDGLYDISGVAVECILNFVTS